MSVKSSWLCSNKSLLQCDDNAHKNIENVKLENVTIILNITTIIVIRTAYIYTIKTGHHKVHK